MFDVKQFMTTQFAAREEDVPVPDLQDFFPDGEKAVWRVRGITGPEYGVVNETAQQNRKSLAEAIEKMVATLSPKDVDSVATLVRDPERVTDELAKRLEMFVIGSVAPAADMELAIKVCRVCPIEFFDITNVINRLTGMGSEAKKKPAPSGKTAT